MTISRSHTTAGRKPVRGGALRPGCGSIAGPGDGEDRNVPWMLCNGNTDYHSAVPWRERWLTNWQASRTASGSRELVSVQL